MCCAGVGAYSCDEADTHVGVHVAVRPSTDVAEHSGAVRSAADGDARDAAEDGTRVVVEASARGTVVSRAPAVPPPALSWQIAESGAIVGFLGVNLALDSTLVLTQAAVMQHCTVELITMPASCVDPARTSSGGWLLHPAAIRCWAAVDDGTLVALTVPLPA